MLYSYNSWDLKGFKDEMKTEMKTEMNSARKVRDYVTGPSCISAPLAIL